MTMLCDLSRYVQAMRQIPGITAAEIERGMRRAEQATAEAALVADVEASQERLNRAARRRLLRQRRNLSTSTCNRS